MKTRFVLHALVAAFAISIATPSFAAEAIGVVGALQGNASAAGASGARTLKVGDQVFLDEEVTTNAGSKLQLMLNDRSTITLNPNSKVKVKEFAYDANSDSGSLAMEGVKGAFRFIGGALSKQNPVTIKTPVSSIGIRGGIADTHIAETTGATDAIFLFGDAMTMTNQNGQTTEVTTPGQGLSMQTPNDVPTFTPPSVIQQHLGSFDPAPASAAATDSGNAATGTEGANTTQGSEQSGQQGAEDAANTTEGNNTGGDQNTAQQGEGAGTPNEGGQNGQAGRGSAADRGTYGSFANANGGPGTQPGPNGNPGTNPFGPGTVGAADANNIASNTTNNASTTNNAGSGTNTGAALSSNAVYRGRYGMAVNQGAAVRERGMLDVGTTSSDLVINAVENAPNSGTVHTGRLPLTTATGYNAISTPFALNPAEGTQYTGFSYGMPGLNSFYYHLDEVGGSDKFNMFFGRQIPLNDLGAAMSNTATLSDTQNTQGISYYLFAPDLLSYEGVSNSPLGFFDYGIKNINGTLGRNTSPFGVAVDWSNKRFLSGAIEWSNTTGAQRPLLMSFGKINPTATGTSPFLQGSNFEFRQTSSTLNSTDVATGNIASPAGVFYGNANNQIESFMIQGQAPGGYSIETPALRIDPTTPLVTIDETRHGATTTMSGFAAGQRVNSIGGTGHNVTTLTTGGSPTNLTVNIDPTNNNVGGEIRLHNKTDQTKTTTVNWGGAGNENAYLSKDLYAGRQGNVVYNDGVNAQVIDSSKNGFVANATEISNLSACKTCEFVHWGVWAGETNSPLPGSGANVQTAALVPYVAGQMTQNLASITGLPTGTVTYNGQMIGTEYNTTAATLDRVNGTFSSDINLGTRQVQSFDVTNLGSISSMSMSGGPVNINGSNAALFNNLALTGSGATGVVNGALFGPAAQNVGGNYTVDATNVSGAGVFLGAR